MRLTAVSGPVVALATALGALWCAGCGGGSAAGEGDAGVDADGGPGCDGGRLDTATDLCWQHPRAPEDASYQGAIDYCDDLNSGGRTDWVLPTRDDFVGLLGGCDGDVLGGGNGYCDPCAESAACGALFGHDIDWYWSSTLYDEGHAWLAHFGDGYLNRSGIGFDFYVRCVRPGP